METCGMGDYEALKEACACLNFMYFDIKSMNPEKHEAFTGHDNERIPGNIRRICAERTRTGLRS